MFGIYNELTREEWFSLFVNAITETFDPHSNYMAPDVKEGFNDAFREIVLDEMKQSIKKRRRCLCNLCCNGNRKSE